MKPLPKILLIPTLIMFLVPSGAFASDNILGLYFDTDANENCLEGIIPFTTFSTYLILSSPTVTELYGFELGMTVVGDSAMFLSYTDFCGISINPVMPELDRIMVGCVEPLQFTEKAVLMSMEWMYMSMDFEMVLFYLHASSDPLVPTTTPMILLADGIWLPVSVDQVNHFESATAVITGSADTCYPLATVERTWDSLKSLYR